MGRNCAGQDRPRHADGRRGGFFLIEALHAESEYTRQQAIDAIVRFGPKAAVSVPRLRALVNDPDAAVRSAAARALTALEPPSDDAHFDMFKFSNHVQDGGPDRARDIIVICGAT